MAEETKAKKKRTTSSGYMVDRPAKAFEKPKPSFNIDEKELPEIKDWTVGKKYKIALEVEMRSHSKGDEYGYDGGGEKRHTARLVILKAGEHDCPAE